MNEPKHSIHWVTFLLSWIAGYCDTATFVAAEGIFSAHVTGNFIVFAAQAMSGGLGTAWVKLLTFPVFVVAVMLGGWLAEGSTQRYKLLLIESILLVGCGLAAVFLPGLLEERWAAYLIVMGVVVAMGLQNSFGKLFAKETFGPTTMMTGNVTQAALDLGAVLRLGRTRAENAWLSLGRQGITISGFLFGCLFGALLANYFGLSAVLLPGMALLVCYLQGKLHQKKLKYKSRLSMV
ncbi:YoaK family protein [Siphonobacter sp.]|uniref:YoaK family protein n=1 Tax=Siphonobacter sp. TaxID=1869184 RepID=UPI003B3A1A3A